MTRKYTIKKGHGNYYRSVTFYYFITFLIMFPLIVLALLVVINPFWFRRAAADKFSNLCIGLNKWRNYKTYKIYLGADPTVWHALKD
jgi:uncharacterized BrkB/YihY/UPF0761 family membrane protein